MLLDHTLVHSEETNAPGYKTAKERVTFMPCSNASGTHKLPLLMIGKSKNPRAFKNRKIPVLYASSRNAWMTRDIFQNWFHETFVPNVRIFLNERGIEPKALLLLDNCSAHHFRDELVSDDGLIEVMFLPPNVTSIIQPMDQNAIQTIKLKYREKLHLDLSDVANVIQRLKEVNLKDVAFWLYEAWMEVPSTVLQKSWKNIGYVLEDKLLHEEDVPLAKLFHQATIRDVDLPGFPEEELCTEAFSDAEIIATLRSELYTPENDEDDNTDGDAATQDETFHQEELHSSCATRAQAVANGLKLAIEWAEDNVLELTDVLHLRRIRNMVLERSIDKL